VEFIAFQSTHPVRGATTIHGNHCGINPFQSTHPVRGATREAAERWLVRMVSIHAPRAGCDASVQLPGGRWLVSIHAPRAGCDVSTGVVWDDDGDVSIHAPRAGCDRRRGKQGGPPRCFNPRTPCGVRPDDDGRRVISLGFQSTHPVRGATHDPPVLQPALNVSIHAPRAGCD